jgi:hypothetical protein
MVGSSFTSVLSARSREFRRRFERTFLQSLHLVQSVKVSVLSFLDLFTPSYLISFTFLKNLNSLSSFAMATFSNLIGGLGYFQGNTKVGGPRELELASQNKQQKLPGHQQQGKPITLLHSFVHLPTISWNSSPNLHPFHRRTTMEFQ